VGQIASEFLETVRANFIAFGKFGTGKTMKADSQEFFDKAFPKVIGIFMRMTAENKEDSSAATKIGDVIIRKLRQMRADWQEATEINIVLESEEDRRAAVQRWTEVMNVIQFLGAMEGWNRFQVEDLAEEETRTREWKVVRN
jgi:hypothetical protein